MLQAEAAEEKHSPKQQDEAMVFDDMGPWGGGVEGNPSPSHDPWSNNDDDAMPPLDSPARAAGTTDQQQMVRYLPSSGLLHGQLHTVMSKLTPIYI